MITLRILENDLHRERSGVNARPLMLETPALPSFLPAIVSDTRGQFIIIRKMKENMLRSGVFEFDSDRIDNILLALFNKAYEISKIDQFENIFSGRGMAKKAHDYIKKVSGFDGQPHVCLIPEQWEVDNINEFFGEKNLSNLKYKTHCRVVTTKVSKPVFCSRPDMVGLYTQFLGGKSSILLHNIEKGIAFCEV